MNTRRIGLVVILALCLATAGYSQAPVNVVTIAGADPVIAICDNPAIVTSANISLSAGTGNTQIVALNSTNVIYVCGFTLVAGGAGDVTWITGTGTACATGETAKETLGFTADAGYGITVSNGGQVQFKSAAGQALCLKRASSVTLKGRVTYVRQ